MRGARVAVAILLLLLAVLLDEVCGGFVGARKTHGKKKHTTKKKKKKSKKHGGIALFNGMSHDECDDLVSHRCKVHWVDPCDKVQYGGGCKQLGNCRTYGCAGGCASDPACMWTGGDGGGGSCRTRTFSRPFLAAGTAHTFLKVSDSFVLAWGYNSDGQLGLNITNTSVTAPTRVTLIGGEVSQIELGALDSCALLTTGSVQCWGRNDVGQLGLNNTNTPMMIPTTLSFIGGEVTQIGLGAQHTCALLTTGEVKCWGYNYYGQLGLNNTNSVSFPTTVTLIGGKASQIALGGDHSCALLTTGAVQCWGDNSYGQLGLNNTISMAVPTTVLTIGGEVSQIALGLGHSCVLLTTGGVQCWGYNKDGELGLNHTQTPVMLPATVPLGGMVKQIALGGQHSCAVLNTGSVQCWGLNEDGQLGLGNLNTPIIFPTTVSIGGEASQIALGESHSCALLVTGAVQCWGDNSLGQLGLDSAQTPIPNPSYISNY